MENPESHAHKPRREKGKKKPMHPLLEKIGTGVAAAALAAGLACTPAARAHDTTTPTSQTVQSTDTRVASATTGPTTVPSRPTTIVAQATRPDTSIYQGTAVGSSGTPENRLYDGGGAILDSSQASPMTQQEFQAQIAYMFDLTSQFEVLPDSSGRYVTDEFIVKRATSLADRAPLDNILIYGKNSLDGGDAREPLDILFSTLEENFRLFRFPVANNSIVKGEVIAVLESGGITFFYFNKLQNRYTAGGAGYGPNYFGPNPKIGSEINTQSETPYIGMVVIDPQNLDSRGKPIVSSEVAAVTLDLNGDGSKTVVGAGLYRIQQ